MKTPDEKSLSFVLQYYKQHKLDTQKALKAFKDKYQITGHKTPSTLYWWLIPTVAAVALITFLVFPRLASFTAWQEVTAHSHTVKYMLPDSSFITLYPHSSIRFHQKDYTAHERTVFMTGKVAFSVKHDSNRPFTVEGNLSQIRVMGTVFTVDESRKDTATIFVTSGKVMCHSIGKKDAVILTKGMKAQVIKGGNKIQIVRSPQTGSFVFDNTPLPKVMEKLSKHYRVKLTATQTNKRLTATFKNKSLNEIVEIIEKVLNISITIDKQ